MEKEINVCKKSLGNTDTNGASKNVSDLVVWGEPDMWKLLSKASSQKEGWMKSTKALEVEGVGCWVQVSTQQGDNVAESISFAENMKIIVTGEIKDENGKTIVTSRRLVSMDYKEDKEDEVSKTIDTETKPEIKPSITIESSNPYEITKRVYMLLKMNKNCTVSINNFLVDIKRAGKTAYVILENSSSVLYSNLDWVKNSAFEEFIEDFGFPALMLTYLEEHVNDLFSSLWDIASPLSGDKLTLSKLDRATKDFTRYVTRELTIPEGKFEFTRHNKEEDYGVDDNYVVAKFNDVEVYRSDRLYKSTTRYMLSTTTVLDKLIAGYISAFKK